MKLLAVLVVALGLFVYGFTTIVVLKQVRAVGQELEARVRQ